MEDQIRKLHQTSFVLLNCVPSLTYYATRYLPIINALGSNDFVFFFLNNYEMYKYLFPILHPMENVEMDRCDVIDEDPQDDPLQFSMYGTNVVGSKSIERTTTDRSTQ